MFLALASLLLAAHGKPSPVYTGPGRDFTLLPGQVALVDGENIAIEFVNVVVDTRRTWGASYGLGEVSCLVLITRLDAPSRPYRGLLTQTSEPGRPAIQMVDGRELVFDIGQETAERQASESGGYRMTMNVLKRAKTALVR